MKDYSDVARRRSEDWLKPYTFDMPDVETGEQLESVLARIGQTPEEFLASPAAQADHPAIAELRQLVYTRNGGRGQL